MTSRAADQHTSRGRLLEAGDEAQRRRLPEPEGPTSDEQLAGPDLEVEPGERLDVAVALRDADEGEPGRYSSARAKRASSSPSTWLAISLGDASSSYIASSSTGSAASSISGHVEMLGTAPHVVERVEEHLRVRRLRVRVEERVRLGDRLQRRHGAAGLGRDPLALLAERELDEPPRRVLVLRVLAACSTRRSAGSTPAP